MAIESFPCTVQLDSLPPFPPPISYLLRSASEGSWKSYHVHRFFICLDYLAGKRGISIIAPGSKLAPILMFEISESKEAEYCIETLFFSFSQLEGRAPALLAQMSARSLATVSEAITREGLPLPCRWFFILTGISFPGGLGGSEQVAGCLL